jgi:hypothetical protein
MSSPGNIWAGRRWRLRWRGRGRRWKTGGWEYEVWSEPPEAQLANLRLLAGYRRKWLFNPDLLDALNTADLDGARLRDALEAVTA